MTERPGEGAGADQWDGVAAAGGGAALSLQIAPAALEAAALAPGDEALDLGCGVGGLSRAAQALGTQMTAVDFAPAMIRAAEAGVGAKAVRFRIGDMRALDAPAGAFDAVFACFSLLESGAPETALREAHRALKPGGRLVLAFWPKDGAVAAAAGDGGSALSVAAEPETMRRLLAGAGFRPLDLRERALRPPVEPAAFQAALQGLTAGQATLDEVAPPPPVDGGGAALKALLLSAEKTHHAGKPSRGAVDAARDGGTPADDASGSPQKDRGRGVWGGLFGALRKR